MLAVPTQLRAETSFYQFKTLTDRSHKQFCTELIPSSRVIRLLSISSTEMFNTEHQEGLVPKRQMLPSPSASLYCQMPSMKHYTCLRWYLLTYPQPANIIINTGIYQSLYNVEGRSHFIASYHTISHNSVIRSCCICL